nr:unknown function [Klebsiella phage vB_Kpn_K17alpha61]
MAKYINLKCSASTMTLFFKENNLYKGKVINSGAVFVRVDGYGWVELDKMATKGMTLEGKPTEAKFVELKTKTLKCVGLNHKNPVKKSFSVGKRYQVESGRALGGVAGYIFDRDGCRWTLYREEVGFSVSDGTTFEAKYL